MSRKRSSAQKKAESLQEVDDNDSPIRENSEDEEVEDKVPKKQTKTNKKSISPSKNKKLSTKGPEANPDGEYKIDRIIEMQVHRNGEREFLVKWAGYSINESTWEPEKNLEGTSVLEKFLKKVEKVKEISPKQLRVLRMPTDRYTLTFPQTRHSKRNDGKQRVKYHDAE